MISQLYPHCQKAMRKGGCEVNYSSWFRLILGYHTVMSITEVYALPLEEEETTAVITVGTGSFRSQVDSESQCHCIECRGALLKVIKQTTLLR